MADFGKRLHATNTKSQSGEECKLNDDPNRKEMRTPRPVTAREADEIGKRLYSATTKSIANQPCKFNAMQAKDLIGSKVTSEAELEAITDRLATTHTKAWSAEPCKATAVVATPREANLTKAHEVEDMVDRLVTTHTKAWSAEPCRAKPIVADNSISRNPVSEEEKREILHRLNKTHTKSTSGSSCRSYEPPKTPGLGQKCMPDIEGLDRRFSGKKVKKDKANDIFTRLSSASTKSSRARNSNAKILLYPERTLLCNNVERIVNFQQSGNVVKQDALARREKWFN